MSDQGKKVEGVEPPPARPRVRFCWSCGQKLWGNHFVEKEIDGHMRIVHKGCSE